VGAYAVARGAAGGVGGVGEASMTAWRWIAANWGAALSLAGAVIAGIGAFVATRQQDQQRVEYEHEIRVRTDSLLAKTEEIAELNHQLAAKNDELARLALRQLDTITGGDSFCTLQLTDLDNPLGPRVTLKHHGDFPLSDLLLSIADSEADLDEGRGMNQLVGTIAVGTDAGLSSNSVRRRFIVSGDAKDFFVGFRAKNGVWRQAVSLRRVDGRWKTATRAYRKEGSSIKELLAIVDEGFPK